MPVTAGLLADNPMFVVTPPPGAFGYRRAVVDANAVSTPVAASAPASAPVTEPPSSAPAPVAAPTDAAGARARRLRRLADREPRRRW